ncbi:putative protein-lysine deacylase ABHD14B isoform X2 [Lineus longissimus]|uniref:putative protein-lysine deacylase ABHD14B isoform X2 n=1 Tax=Lineus longissimus TaxID=88925 RepID=UPI002B4F4BE5
MHYRVGTAFSPDDNGKMRKDARQPRCNKTFIVCIVVVIFLALYLYYSYSTLMAQNKEVKSAWNSFDYGAPPADLMEKATSVPIHENTIKLTVGGIKLNLFYRSAGPQDKQAKTPVLFLHGASFTSKTWQDLGTLGLLALLGHQVVAVDLPGFGSTSSASNVNRVEFIEEIIKQTKIVTPPIIVLPSMGGGFGLPYVMEAPEKAYKRISGIIAIAPVNTGTYTHAQFHRITVPTMIIRGEKDKGLGLQALSNLQNTQNNVHFVMEKCGHAAYMNDSPKWHELLYNYVMGVEKEKLYLNGKA